MDRHKVHVDDALSRTLVMEVADAVCSLAYLSCLVQEFMWYAFPCTREKGHVV